MTFLELCQFVARESSVVAGTQPTTVTGQTGKLGKIVNWVADAWKDIQLLRPDWFWMEGEFTSSSSVIVSGGTGRFTAASLGLDVTRFGDWKRDKRLSDGTIYRPMSIYLEATGVSDESSIVEISWERWRIKYGRGTQTENRPGEWAVSPLQEICLGALPNASFLMRGTYQKAPQVLAAAGDIPEMPAQFHRMIGWNALALMVRHDEAPTDVLAGAITQYQGFLSALEAHQVEEMTLGGDPIA